MPVQQEAPALTDSLSRYRAEWPIRAYDRERVGGPDELRDVTSSEDVSSFRLPPADPYVEGAPPIGGFGDGSDKFLWVVRSADVPYAPERGATGRTIAGRGKLSHTNLTGGADAHCGGELWFRNHRSVWLTGGSGRYEPRSAQELEAVVDALRTAGYEVTSAGWSAERGGPARYFREEAA